MYTDDIVNELEDQRKQIEGMIAKLEDARDNLTDAIYALR